MGVMLIEISETMVYESYYDIPVTDNVSISWTPTSVICVWCFNGNINSSWYFWTYTRSQLTTELHMEPIFYRQSIVDVW